uniref:Reverse transcriptase domain-containing protein n=1 Tax=Amphimedon queenslandica TaxID=400682 RepID=A0A1X7UDI3_AMPQE
MAEGLQRKEGKRCGFRDVLVGRLEEAKDILIAADVDPVKLEQLRLYVNEKHSALKKLDEEILELLDDDEAIVAEIGNADKFNDRIYESLAKIEVQLRSVNRVSKDRSATVSSDAVTSKTKLPKLNVPVFKGNVTEWLTFWDLYNVAVHCNDSISPGLLKRLRRNPELLREYNQFIKDQIDNGIVEVVEDPTLVEGERVHYLPHHGVVRHDKRTTKLRIVYDASAKSNGLSLNECLHVGPKFNQKIFEILVRFRVHRNGFIADVEKAILMISVNKCDRDVLRFLWVTDPYQEPAEIQVLRFKRVTFGVTVSPFLLNATMRYHIESYKEERPNVVERLLQSVYVDDVVCGTESVESSVEMFEKFRAMLSTGGFNLKKFVTSGQSVAGGGAKGIGSDLESGN